ncbi:MAG TPA: two-component system sensor histidine kinase DcuS [Bacillus bacterium]|nr:two-component system sensor histidine kinase DcuS [Bacillus sp. (in: firmicutes)]
MIKRLKLHYMLIILVCIVVFLSILITGILIEKTVTARVEKSLEEKAFTVSRTVAQTPHIIDALEGRIAESEIQSFTSKIQKSTNVKFVVVIDMNGIRKSHPNPENIGKRFEGGDEAQALDGKEYASISEGSLGMSLRALTPIYNEDGKQLGAVAVGISLDRIEYVLGLVRGNINEGILLGLLFGIIGAILLAQFVKRILLGLEPFQIAKLLNERHALIESVHEGIIAVDHNGLITLVNQSALKLLRKAGLEDDPIGKRADDYMTASHLDQTLVTGKASLDQEDVINGMELMTSRVPIIVDGLTVGAVKTLRDKSEIKQLADQLTGVWIYADALRAQSHEFMNQLHCIMGLIHLKEYEKLETFINQVVENSQTEISHISKKIKDPAIVGFLLGKLSFARESGVKLCIQIDNSIPEAKESRAHEIITIAGNLINNAVEATANSENKTVELFLKYDNETLKVEVRDSGEGIKFADRKKLFDKGFSTKGENRGYGLFLVRQTVEKLNGMIDISGTNESGTMMTVTIPYLGEGGEND